MAVTGVIVKGIIKSILLVLAGIGTGLLLRQPEVTKLKKDNHKLKEQLSVRLKFIVEELNRQIDELNKRYLALKTIHFIEKKKIKLEIEQKQEELRYMKICCCEYLRLLGISLTSPLQLNEDENKFINIFTNLLNNQNVDANAEFINSYINTKNYSPKMEINLEEEIDNLIPDESNNN